MNGASKDPGGTVPAAASAPRRWQAGANRRQALRYGAAGTCLLAGGGSLAWSWFNWFQSFQDEVPADIFKGDAPTGKTWELWRQRGWVKEAYHYLKMEGNTQCKVCPNNCILTPGDRSHCRNKVNHQGTLYTLAYGNPCTFHIDPVEKKPLFHFLPGTPTFSLATSGCVFRCLNCQNWEISQKKPEETKDASGPPFVFRPPLPASISSRQMAALSMFPEDVVAVAQALHCPSISYTYSEPTSYFEYAYDTCKAARGQKVKNILVSCGSIEERPLRDLGQYVDAAHVDLKGFDEETYRKLNSGKLGPILATLKTLKSLGVWFEVINLVVPTYTDRPEAMRKMCGWIVDNLGPDQPLHFSRFSPLHRLTHLPPTPVAILLEARRIAQAAGLRYVYIGNVPGLPDAETTFCPGCKKAVVERDLFAVTALKLDHGKCRFCQTPIAGVWPS